MHYFIPKKGVFDAEVKIRYAAAPVPSRVIPCGKNVRVQFNCPQRAVTPGQAAVFYDGDYVIGGGTIIG
jgi:tRNA-specific 2-thiouridylase